MKKYKFDIHSGCAKMLFGALTGIVIFVGVSTWLWFLTEILGLDIGGSLLASFGLFILSLIIGSIKEVDDNKDKEQ